MSVKIRGKLYNLDVIANLVAKKRKRTNNLTRTIEIEKFSKTDFMLERYYGKLVNKYVSDKQKVISLDNDIPVIWCKDNHYGVVTGEGKIINAIIDGAITIECTCISLSSIERYA
jgi:hypothetical protein